MSRIVADLGLSPLANAFLRELPPPGAEPVLPLCAYVCDRCFLVQVGENAPPLGIFNSEYAYFSGFSSTWRDHCAAYAARMIQELHLGPRDLVVEIASNDGTLLDNFRRAGVSVLGVEPAANLAAAAEARGVPTTCSFLTAETARKMNQRANLLVANNVLAHVPDLHDFVEGLRELLRPEGILTIEFPHLQRLLEQCQFDTIYHEHYSYFSLATATRVLGEHSLRVFDVEELPTHGGSLRLLVCHAENREITTSPRVAGVVEGERRAGLRRADIYDGFASQVERVKASLIGFLQRAANDGHTVAAYGAPAKGNTLLNTCGIRSDLVAYTVDRNPHKQGGLLPGSHLPVYAPEHIAATRPDYLLILPWNIRDEIMKQMEGIRAWGGRFVTAIPELSVY